MLEHVKSAKPVKLGYLPTHRFGVFATEAAKSQKDQIEQKLQQLGIEYVGLDWLNEEGLLYEPTDAPAVAERFRREGVDAVFAAHCDFGQEVAVGRVCKALRKPVLLWGPRDEAPAPTGERERDTQCGLFATSKLLRRLGLPFTYVVNCHLDDEVLARGMDLFLRAANVARSVRGARIGQISTRPTPFTSTMCNESELLERFDVELVPVTLPDVLADVRAGTGADDVAREVEGFRSRLKLGNAADDDLRRVASLKLRLMEWAAREELDAIAIQCWDLRDDLGVVPCFVHGELASEGIPVACETDVNGAITSLALQAAAMARTPIFFADLTIRHPENDNSELLWHCGPFPVCLAAEGAEPSMAGHYMVEGEPQGLGEFEIRGGSVTLGRFDGDNGEYRFLMGHAEGCEGPHTRGTYLWVQVPNWPLWEERLIYGPYIHHIVGIHGKLAPALYEGTKYLGVEPEPVQPTEEEIRGYMRGQAEL